MVLAYFWQGKFDCSILFNISTPILVVVDAVNVVPFFKVEQLKGTVSGVYTERVVMGCAAPPFNPILTVVDVFKVEKLKGTRVVCVPRGW